MEKLFSTNQTLIDLQERCKPQEPPKAEHSGNRWKESNDRCKKAQKELRSWEETLKQFQQKSVKIQKDLEELMEEQILLGEQITEAEEALQEARKEFHEAMEARNEVVNSLKEKETQEDPKAKPGDTQSDPPGGHDAAGATGAGTPSGAEGQEEEGMDVDQAGLAEEDLQQLNRIRAEIQAKSEEARKRKVKEDVEQAVQNLKNQRAKTQKQQAEAEAKQQQEQEEAQAEVARAKAAADSLNTTPGMPMQKQDPTKPVGPTITGGFSG